MEPKDATAAKRQPRLEEEVFVDLVRTVDALSRAGEELLKPHGLTGTQYNVLRILRGAGREGLACGEIGCRMIKRDPDITRLLDRIEARGLIARMRHPGDRRVVTTSITPEGQRILATLDGPVQALYQKQLQGLPAKELRILLRLLRRARAGVEGEPVQEQSS